MKISGKVKDVLVECIALLYIVLFVYAAVNKILVFDEFQVQIAQSPLLTSFAGWMSYLVPIVEIVIAVLLSLKKTRLQGLYAAFCLMVMFTIYIAIILNFSPYIPCSCGGILEKLGWRDHLIFNVVFCFIAVIGIVLQSKLDFPRQHIRRLIFKIAVLIVFAGVTVLMLYVVSEDMHHHRNNFTRRFYGTPAEVVKDLKLESKSYIAGAGHGKVYICDNRDPLKVFEFDNDLSSVTTRIIRTNEPNRAFKSLRTVIKPPYFYLYDGREAFAFSGNLLDWQAKIWIDQVAYYNSFVAIDSSQAAIRSVSADANESVIGIMKNDGSEKVTFNKNLLDKQIDGFFDTDGKLLFNSKHQKLIYVYYYRNEYLITNTSLSEKKVAHTIDTTSKANIKVVRLKDTQASTIASPMRIVNKSACTEGDFLYIHSNLIGQFEQKEMWKQASVVDVYSLLDNSYLFSFYLYDKHGHKISDFVVDNGKIYTIAGLTLTVYDFNATPYKKSK